MTDPKDGLYAGDGVVWPYDRGPDFSEDDYGRDDLDKAPGNDEGIG